MVLKKIFLAISLLFLVGFCTTGDTALAQKSIVSSTITIKDDIVTLYGEVSDASAYAVVTKIHELQFVDKDKPILLLLDSPGGSVEAGLRIIDAMQISARPVYTVVIGEAASMAAYIHSYGVKRLMFPRANLMYHMASNGMIGEINHSTERLKYVQALIDDLDENICKRSGKVTLEEFRIHKANEWYVLAKEAKELNLVDGVVNLSNFPASGKPDKKEKLKAPAQ